MKQAMVGLGRMGMNMARRLLRGGHQVVTLITKAEPSPGIVKVLEYIRGEGKKYIEN